MFVSLKCLVTTRLRNKHNMSRAFRGIKSQTYNKANNRKASLSKDCTSLEQRKNIEEPSFTRTVSKQSLLVSPAKHSFLALSREDEQEFINYFPEIVSSLTQDEEYSEVIEVMKRLATCVEYCVPNGKKLRGLTTVLAYKMLEKPENLTTEKIKLANILGWCTELLQSAFIIADDIVDNSEMRRGVPCWFKIQNVGLLAINDYIFIENSVHTILKKYFSSLTCYIPILELFHEATIKTDIGQFLDNMSIVDGKPRLDEFTMKRYKNIVKYKTAYYSFRLPVTIAMYLANIYDADQHRKATTVLLEIGELYQIQDDFLDSFGDSSVTGKIGSDIKNGKCTWLVVVALQKATPAQRKIIQEHYGKPMEESIRTIRHLYEELGLPTMYKAQEEESFNIIRTHILQMSNELPRELFLWLVENISKRKR